MAATQYLTSDTWVRDLEKQLGCTLNRIVGTLHAVGDDGYVSLTGHVGTVLKLSILVRVHMAGELDQLNALVFWFADGRRIASSAGDFQTWRLSGTLQDGEWAYMGWERDEYGEWSDLEHSGQSPPAPGTPARG